ncbi:hypothetical protein Micbo1qcDRAFT_73208 [Microdochium bolleyi]|uniref:Uncharacterized protein n=1 Tax=Microdochium bolleyi TaxID=196109 RepID=A0A136IYD5_9PEZI|nr:hypothetical protein Micbo1qcDRAFT_73208 [Microdochium bolleyi]
MNQHAGSSSTYALVACSSAWPNPSLRNSSGEPICLKKAWPRISPVVVQLRSSGYPLHVSTRCSPGPTRRHPFASPNCSTLSFHRAFHESTHGNSSTVAFPDIGP